MVEFPSICPVSRKYTPPQYPTKRYAAISGAGTTRLYGSKGFDATLSLQFMVNSSELIEINDCWRSSRGDYMAVDLPDPVIASTEDLAKELSSDHLEWHWAGAPSIESVNPDLYRVTANFVAQLEINP